jgi:hypothetical protein
MSRSGAGFTTLELLVAMALTIVVVGAVLELASADAFTMQSQVSDMQQRLRVAAATVFHDLSAAASVRPYRAGGAAADPPGTFKPDTVTVFSESTEVTYWLKTDDRAGAYQLMSSTGGSSLDVPVVDHVVGLHFEYFGDPRPPTMASTLADPVGPWTTYGPRPLDVAVPPYGPRENCVFQDNGTEQPSPRLPALVPDAGTLVVLGPSQLSDGPWCPDASDSDRWDADLLRVRTIAVTLRVQAASAALRGPAGVLFVHQGRAHISQRWAPDLEVRFRISPRNLNHAT